MQYAHQVVYPPQGLKWIDKKKKIGNQIIHSNEEFQALAARVKEEAAKP